MSENGSSVQNKDKDNRQLTEAELRRKENFLKIEQDYLSRGYRRVDLTVSIMKANTVGILITLPLMAAITVAFIIYNHGLESGKLEEFPWPDYLNMVFFLVAFIAFIVIHEGIHGLSWAIGIPGHFKNIEFGFVVKMLTPYCTCKVPMPVPLYVFGSLMPMTVLGIIPGILCIFFANLGILGFFILQILAGAGDLLISIMVIKHMSRTKCKDVVLIDHPYECGAVIFEK